jgi:hypothetical protein
MIDIVKKLRGIQKDKEDVDTSIPTSVDNGLAQTSRKSQGDQKE